MRRNPFYFKYCDIQIQENHIILFGFNYFLKTKIHQKPIIIFTSEFNSTKRLNSYKILKIKELSKIDFGTEITIDTNKKHQVNNELFLFDFKVENLDKI